MGKLGQNQAAEIARDVVVAALANANVGSGGAPAGQSIGAMFAAALKEIANVEV